MTGKWNSVPEYQLSYNLLALKPSTTFYCQDNNDQTQALLLEPTPAHIPSPNLYLPASQDEPSIPTVHFLFTLEHIRPIPTP